MAPPSSTKIASANQVTPLDNFSFSCPTKWPKWKRQFARFRIASGLNKKSEEEQVKLLIYYMGGTADDIFMSFTLSDDENKQFTKVLECFEAHFIIKRNIIHERARFNTRVQEEGESVDDFIASIYAMSEYCEFGIMREDLLRDRIVVGVRDKKISEKMQRDDKLTLEEAVIIARHCKAVKQKNKKRVCGQSTSSVLNNVMTRPNQPMQGNDKIGPGDALVTSQCMPIVCKFCGITHKFKKRCCPAIFKKYSNRFGKDHIPELCSIHE